MSFIFSFILSRHSYSVKFGKRKINLGHLDLPLQLENRKFDLLVYERKMTDCF